MYIPFLSAMAVLSTLSFGAPVSEPLGDGLDLGKRAYDSPIFLAARQLVSFFDEGINGPTGLSSGGGQFGPANQPRLWQSAVALSAVLEYRRVTGDDYFGHILPKMWTGLQDLPDWMNYDNDDMGWYGQAWLRGYADTKDKRYLVAANKVAKFMNKASWDHKYKCEVTDNHGLTWNSKGENSEYKQSITNSLNIEILATLGAFEEYRNVNGFDMVQRAKDTVEWFKNRELITNGAVGDGYHDGESGACDVNPYTWTYNQGQLMSGLVALAETTGDNSYIDLARQIGDSMLKILTTTGDSTGILREPCETNVCTTNAQIFKGPGIHGLARLNRKLSDKPYTKFIQNNLESMKKNARKNNDYFEKDRFGLSWWTSYVDDNGNGFPAQAAALELFNAAEQQ